jgi:hypothetical protein
VVADGTAAPRALAAASPEFLLDVGGAASRVDVGLSPRARLGLVQLAPTEGEPARQVHDLVWNATGADPWADLAAALRTVS